MSEKNQLQAKDIELKQGELMRAESASPVPVRKEGILRQLLSSPSKWPFLNRFSKKSLESARDVVKVQDELVKAVVTLGKSCGDLDDIDIIVATDHDKRETPRIEAEDALIVARLKKGAREKDKKIYETNKDAEVKRAEHEAQKQDLDQRKVIADLKKQVGIVEQPEKKPRGTPASKKQAEITKEIRRYEKEKERIDNGGDSPEAEKRLLKAALGSHEQALGAIEAMYKKGP